jgi:hypothetical protein
VIIIWFVLERDRRAENERLKRDTEWRQWLESASQQNREFFLGERLARTDATTRLAEEIKQNTIKLAEVAVILTEHDRRAREHWDNDKERK